MFNNIPTIMSFKMHILPRHAGICHVARALTSFSQVLNLMPGANLRINASKTDVERSKIHTLKICSSNGIYIIAITENLKIRALDSTGRMRTYCRKFLLVWSTQTLPEVNVFVLLSSTTVGFLLSHFLGLPHS